MDRQQIFSRISAAAAKVHRALGPGLLEPVYRSCMLLEMENSGIHYRSGVPVPIFYEGRRIRGQKLVIDLLVENMLVVELCAVERLQDFHIRKIFTHLKLASKPLGALINFGERLSVTAFPGFSETRYQAPSTELEMGAESRQRIAARQKDPAFGHKGVHALTGP
jgi:GxxExxY protein